MIRVLSSCLSSGSNFAPKFLVRCSLCGSVYGNGALVRTLATETSTVVSTSPKKKNRKTTGYTDLVEVSKSNFSERKTRVKRIEGQTFSEIDSTLLNSVINEETDTFAEEESAEADADLPKASSVRVEVPRSQREKLSKIDSNAMELAGKERNLNDSLVSYVELCVACGSLSRGMSSLTHYLARSELRNNPKVTDVRIFNSLLDGFAKTGNADKFFEVWELMEKNKITPNLSSFASRIEAIARSSKSDKSNHLNKCLRSMASMGISPNDIFNKVIWKKDSREVVLSAIRAVRPNFLPVINPVDTSYNCNLVNALNDLDTSKLKSPAEGLVDRKMLKTYFLEQLKVEQSILVAVKSIEKEPTGAQVQIFRSKLEKLQEEWEKTIMSALHREMTALNIQHKNYRVNANQINIYPYLCVLDKSQYKDVIMNEIRKLAEGSETFSPTSYSLHRDIGQQIKLRYDVKVKEENGALDKMQQMYNLYSQWYLEPFKYQKSANGRQNWQLNKSSCQKGPSMELETAPWSVNIQSTLGKFLYNIILKDIKIDVNILKNGCNTRHLLPAFYTVYRYQNQQFKEEIKPHPVLSKLFRAACLPQLVFNVTDVPMVCPPIPWISLNYGGYLIAKADFVRLPFQALHQMERLKDTSPTQIYPNFDALNQLGSVPWKINKPVLDTIIEVFNSGGSVELDIPLPPGDVVLNHDSNKSDEKMTLIQWRQLRRQKAEMYSLWCDALYRLSLANHFRDKIFWLPHNMDFRGRVYPCPPHLNHLGSDMSRSLLVFAKGEPLGAEGLNWLKIHLVNLTGLKKKESIQSRLDYADSILPIIIDSAENPLNGQRWWAKSEEPWQTLACAIEIRNALNHPDGPESYVSHFPVHQDGSCNGLQHYAALGRDSVGAKSVNLTPSDVPQDVYSCVAAIVERQRSEDAQTGNEIARVLDGFVKRKVVKQTVMTTVYGVTRYGARLQIAKQLKDIEEFPQEYVWPASSYLASKTFESLREMFTSTREIQDWFTECARMISRICGQNVEYVTPLGLPVVQPYVRFNKTIKTKQLRTAVHLSMPTDIFERPNVMKQKNAFPPNFIHSLDSTHMMLTSLYCERAGITFVSVHDCYWTHPRTIATMSKICREQFVALHSQPILQELSDFLIQRFGFQIDDTDEENLVKTKLKLNELLKTLPSTGDFDLNEVLKSVYFFS